MIKAFVTLLDSTKRRQYDSVDPLFDEEIPEMGQSGDFFEIYRPVFDRNAPFSNIQPVPSLGDLSSERNAVELFYHFWFNFDSWRSFESLDEQSSENAEGRDEKRWIDKKNKANRAKLKKEDNKRMSTLVDQASKLDPRVLLFKNKEKDAKDAKKKEKEDAIKAIAMEIEKVFLTNNQES